jgi:hypothetical protein
VRPLRPTLWRGAGKVLGLEKTTTTTRGVPVPVTSGHRDLGVVALRLGFLGP